jgi:hypothetical protein
MLNPRFFRILISSKACPKRRRRLIGVQIDLGKDDHDHFISPEERFASAMARQ